MQQKQHGAIVYLIVQQWDYTAKEDAKSPTLLIESLIIYCFLEYIEGSVLEIADIPWDFMLDY